MQSQELARETRLRGMMEKHGRFVARALRSERVPPADLDDGVQRTFIIVAKRLECVRLDAERSYLYHVARNIALHVRRTLARHRETLVDEPPEIIDDVATPENLLYRRQMRDLLEGVLGEMSEALRHVLTLYEIEKRSMREIAELLGIPRGTVASRLRRARQEFRSHAVAAGLA
jgi:RNA polymerase sigma-70 factor (ECF subfamily)